MVSWGADERSDASAVDRFGEPARLALRDGHMGVMREPIDGSRGRALGKIVSNRAGCRLEVTISDRFS
jgi:hypothetical protein